MGKFGMIFLVQLEHFNHRLGLLALPAELQHVLNITTPEQISAAD